MFIFSLFENDINFLSFWNFYIVIGGHDSNGFIFDKLSIFTCRAVFIFKNRHKNNTVLSTVFQSSSIDMNQFSRSGGFEIRRFALLGRFLDLARKRPLVWTYGFIVSFPY